jgi:hypothetical protein
MKTIRSCMKFLQDNVEENLHPVSWVSSFHDFSEPQGPMEKFDG